MSLPRPLSLVKSICKALVVYHLPKQYGNFRWHVNGKPILVFSNGKFPEKIGFLER